MVSSKPRNTSGNILYSKDCSNVLFFSINDFSATCIISNAIYFDNNAVSG